MLPLVWLIALASLPAIAGPDRPAQFLSDLNSSDYCQEADEPRFESSCDGHSQGRKHHQHQGKEAIPARVHGLFNPRVKDYNREAVA